MPSTHLRAVIFDIGGVVVRSPLLAIDSFEREMGLPHNYINCAISRRGENGAWQRFERGELDLLKFYDAFSRELSDTDSCNAWYAEYCGLRNITCPELPKTLQIDGRDLFGRMMRESNSFDDNIVEAIRRIRAAKRWRVIALTNNYSKAEKALTESERQFLGWNGGATSFQLRSLFDDFCDSSVLGLRKPGPEFYLLACRRNNVQPNECVFLDDLGTNLKTARKLGMRTIHVPINGSFVAIRKLEELLGIDLISPRPESKL